MKYDHLTDAQLRRKADQEWDMAGLARQDNDRLDALAHTNRARSYEAALAERKQ